MIENENRSGETPTLRTPRKNKLKLSRINDGHFSAKMGVYSMLLVGLELPPTAKSGRTYQYTRTSYAKRCSRNYCARSGAIRLRIRRAASSFAKPKFVLLPLPYSIPSTISGGQMGIHWTVR